MAGGRSHRLSIRTVPHAGQDWGPRGRPEGHKIRRYRRSLLAGTKAFRRCRLDTWRQDRVEAPSPGRWRAPSIAEIIGVDHLGANPLEYSGEARSALAFYTGHSHERGRRFRPPEAPLSDMELVHVFVVPPHRGLQHAVYPVSAMAEAEASVLFIEKCDIRELCAKYPSLALAAFGK